MEEEIKGQVTDAPAEVAPETPKDPEEEKKEVVDYRKYNVQEMHSFEAMMPKLIDKVGGIGKDLKTVDLSKL